MEIKTKVAPKKETDQEYRNKPHWKKLAKFAKENPPTFESEGDRKDYERNLRGNDNNIPGAPLFPPKRFRTNGIGGGMPTEVLPCGHQWRAKTANPGGRLLAKCKYGHQYEQIGDKFNGNNSD